MITQNGGLAKRRAPLTMLAAARDASRRRRGGCMQSLAGHVAIVTGASKGIGRITAELFAAQGARVVCAARTPHLVAETVGRIRDAGHDATAVVGDASRQDDAERLVAAAVGAYGRLTCLVNNAGDSGPTRPIQEYSLDDWRDTLDSCLTSAYLCSRFAVPQMIANGGGTIVNVASMAGRRGLPYRVGYCAAKAGQMGLTYGLAVELGPHNIRVNAILPGAVAGDRIDRVIAGQAQLRGISEEQMRKTFVDRAPLKRMSTGEDVAQLAVFLCSDASRNISGQCIPVNAGDPAS
jgi:NAD(P)-dependent dehydrogenase (short-subunit alcohol dehydrogenase family)